MDIRRMDVSGDGHQLEEYVYSETIVGHEMVTDGQVALSRVISLQDIREAY